MIMNRRFLIIVIATTSLFTIPMAYFMWKEDNTCDTHVLMKDGTEYSAMEVQHNASGITWLKKCDGTETSFPTVDIKAIEKINQ